MKTTLRPLRADDVDGVLDVARSAGTFLFVQGAPNPYLREHAAAHVAQLLEERRQGHRGVAICIDGAYVGNIVIRPPRSQRGLPAPPDCDLPELGFSLHASRRKQGVMSAVLPTFLADVTDVLGARSHLDNIASGRLLEKNGFAPIARDGPWQHWRRDPTA